MANHMQTPPNLPLVEGLARDDERQSLANLQVPHRQPRKRRSTDAIREQSQPQKHVMVEPGGDGHEIALEDVCVAMARIKREPIERGKTGGYVQIEIEIEVAKPLNGRHCTCCGDLVHWQGKCSKCIRDECFRWLDGIPPDVEPHEEDIKLDEGDQLDEYVKILGDLYQQNEARIVEDEEKWKKFLDGKNCMLLNKAYAPSPASMSDILSPPNAQLSEGEDFFRKPGWTEEEIAIEYSKGVPEYVKLYASV